MTAVVLVLAGGTASSAAVKGVLQDWCAVGLVQDLIWVDEAALATGGSRAALPGQLLGRDGLRQVEVREHLANRRGLTLLRVCALGFSGGNYRDTSQARADLLRNELAGLASRLTVSALHCQVTRHGRAGWESTSAWLGWHNIVLAPEDAWAPGDVPQPMLFETAEAAFFAHAAAGLAGAAGLWCGVSEGPFDAVDRVGDLSIVTRSFLRRLDATPVVQALRSALTDVRGGLRPPAQGRRPLPHLENAPAACSQVATDVFSKHQALFVMRRETVRAQDADAVPVLVLLRVFFSFLAAALRNAPREWIRGVADRGSQQLARRVQHAVYGGEQTRYEAVVRGVTASGRRADVHSFGLEAAELARRVEPARTAVEHSTPQLGALWKDVAAGALTLADAGAHAPGVAPVTVDGLPAVVRSIADIAPAPEDVFDVATYFAADLQLDRVLAYDPLTAHQLRSDLASIADAGSRRSRDASVEGERFARWYQPFSHTYVVAVGERIARHVSELLADVRRLLRELDQASGEQVDEPAMEREGASLARRMLLFLAVALVAVPAIVVGVASGALPALAGSLFVAAVAAGWLAASLVAMLTFYRRQRALFAALHGRDAQESRMTVLQRNLANASYELSLATTMYAQYLEWAPVLGRFLREPFGRLPDAAAERLRLGGPFPRAMALGIAHPQRDEVDALARELSLDLLQPGWLGDSWSNLLAAAPRRLAGGAQRLGDDLDQLFRDRAVASDSLLREWSRDVIEHGVGAASGDAFWAQARELLSGPNDSRLTERLFGTIELVGHQAHEVVTGVDGSTFLNELLGGAGTGAFDHHLFQTSAVVADATRVESAVVVGGEGAPQPVAAGRVRELPAQLTGVAGLDRFVLLVQCAPARHPRELKLEGEHPDANDHSAGGSAPQPPPVRLPGDDDPFSGFGF